jgi:hypothetical protein
MNVTTNERGNSAPAYLDLASKTIALLGNAIQLILTLVSAAELYGWIR